MSLLKSIVIFTDSFWPDSAGVGNATLSFARALIANGWQVEVITPKRKADLPIAEGAGGCSAVNGKIYVIGGTFTPYGAPREAVQEYDVATDTWTTKAALPTARAWLSSSVVNGKIYAIGGTWTYQGTPLSTVEEYDPSTDTDRGKNTGDDENNPRPVGTQKAEQRKSRNKKQKGREPDHHQAGQLGSIKISVERGEVRLAVIRTIAKQKQEKMGHLPQHKEKGKGCKSRVT